MSDIYDYCLCVVTADNASRVGSSLLYTYGAFDLKDLVTTISLKRYCRSCK
jgi:hypothetical protein